MPAVEAIFRAVLVEAGQPCGDSHIADGDECRLGEARPAEGRKATAEQVWKTRLSDEQRNQAVKQVELSAQRFGYPTGTPTKLETIPLAKLKPTQEGDDRINSSSEASAREIKIAAERDSERLRKMDVWPILVDGPSGKILDGNHRFSAAETLGDSHILALTLWPKGKRVTAGQPCGDSNISDEKECRLGGGDKAAEGKPASALSKWMATWYSKPGQKSPGEALAAMQKKAQAAPAQGKPFNPAKWEPQNEKDWHKPFVEPKPYVEPPDPKGVDAFRPETDEDERDSGVNGIGFAKLKSEPAYERIKDVPGLDDKPLPDISKKPWMHVATGAVIKEADGRIWVVAPKNGYAGYDNTFPKGTVDDEDGLSLQQSAHREVFEESGLRIRLTGHVGDFESDQSLTRYYLAERVGGSPYHHDGKETAAVKLATPEQLRAMLNRSRDRKILHTTQEKFSKEGTKISAASPKGITKPDTDALGRNILAKLTGVNEKWLAPVKPVFDALAAKAGNGAVSDADFIAAIKAAARTMPALFDRLDTKTLATALERAMGSAMANGAQRAMGVRPGQVEAGEYSEDLHPRDENGKFTDGGNGGSAADGKKDHPPILYHAFYKETGSGTAKREGFEVGNGGIFGLAPDAFSKMNPFEWRDYGDEVVAVHLNDIPGSKIFKAADQAEAVQRLFGDAAAAEFENDLEASDDPTEAYATADKKIIAALKKQGKWLIHYSNSEQFGNEYAVLDRRAIREVKDSAGKVSAGQPCGDSFISDDYECKSGGGSAPERPKFLTSNPVRQAENKAAVDAVEKAAKAGDVAALAKLAAHPSPKVAEYAAAWQKAGKGSPADKPKAAPAPVPAPKPQPEAEKAVVKPSQPGKPLPEALAGQVSALKAAHADHLKASEGEAHFTKPAVVKAQASLASTLLKGGAIVDAGVRLMEAGETAKAHALLGKLTKGAAKDAFQKSLANLGGLPVHDLGVLSEVEWMDTPYSGLAYCNMGTRKIAMGSNSTNTGDSRHELGHAIHSMYLQGDKNGEFASKVESLYDEAMAKANADPNLAKNKMSHETSEIAYGVAGRRGLDNSKENFAEHYRLYHREMFRERNEGKVGALAQYRQRHPEWAKLWDAHYTVGLMKLTT